MSYIIALLAGAMLPLAFAPFAIWPLAIVALTTLAFIWQASPPKRAFVQGFAFGLGMFGFGVSWVFVSIYKFGNTNVAIATLITAMFVVTLALFIATQGYILKKFYPSGGIKYSAIGFPTIWVLFEWIRSWLFTGFPWLYIGYTQTDSVLKSFAPILGVYGISFLLALSSGLIFYVLNNLVVNNLVVNNFLKTTLIKEHFRGKLNQKNTIANLVAIATIIAIWSVGIVLQEQNWTQPSGKKLSVALLQGNISPVDKFLLNDPIAVVDNLYGTMTRKHLATDLIIWPETALPVALPYAQAYLDTLDEVAKTKTSTVILGLPEEAPDKEHYFNSLVALGHSHGKYHKIKLVPFGDYLPFEKQLRGLIGFFDLPMSTFINGNGKSPILDLKVATIMPLICYEIAFPQHIRNIAKNNDVGIIVTISEDGWFGNSIGPHQHLQMAKMRALETGKYVLRATTNGISAIIAPNGTIQDQAPQFMQFVLQGECENMLGTTPWVLLGANNLMLVLVIAFIILQDMWYNRSYYALYKLIR